MVNITMKVRAFLLKIQLWHIILGGFVVDSIAWASAFRVFDVSMAVNLTIIEVPIGVLVGAIIGAVVGENIKQAKQIGEEVGKNIQKVQDREARISDFANYLTAHYENEILPVLHNWFSRSPPLISIVTGQMDIQFLRLTELTYPMKGQLL